MLANFKLKITWFMTHARNGRGKKMAYGRRPADDRRGVTAVMVTVPVPERPSKSISSGI